MFDKDIPGSNCIGGKNYSCIYLIYILFHEKCYECYPLNKALQLGGNLSCR